MSWSSALELAALAALSTALASASQECTTLDSDSCHGFEEELSLLQKLKIKEPLRTSHDIVVKGPPESGGTPVEVLAPSCAAGFNSAYAACLGSKNAGLMHMFTDAEKRIAWCAYQGGKYMSTDYYPDSGASCYASPGQSQPLFYDNGVLMRWDWDTTAVITGVQPYKDTNALTCFDYKGAKPCTANDDVRLWRAFEPGQLFSFTWDDQAGYTLEHRYKTEQASLVMSSTHTLSEIQP
ncbi:unnamed protein product [Polarella glacialis]|uniref:Uncharacterized protein n=1 Tax=Polarella glacialis TaxID=89957 RepID=A0A813FE43_POLGL|nr:unnamed protein product [Polarella glacialis]